MVVRTDSAGAGPGRSRRQLLRAALVGGAALVTAPMVEAGPAQAKCPIEGPCYPLRQYLGTMTVGAVLQTYASAPLSARGTMTWTTSTSRTETFKVTTETGRTVAPSITLGPFKFKGEDENAKEFSIGGGLSYTQGKSSTVSSSMTVASTETQSIQTAPTTSGGYNTWENTAFLMLARPVMRVYALYLSPDRIAATEFEFVSGGTIFPRSARELRDDPATRNYIGSADADAVLAEYPLRPDQTSGTQLGLGGPRFGPPTAIAPGAPPYTFTRSMTRSRQVVTGQSRTVDTSIKAGFSILGIVEFAYNHKLSFTHTSAQEKTNAQVVSVTGVLSSDLNHLNYVYEDRAWNTLLITDEGPLPASGSRVTGIVTAAGGEPVAGAVVTMPAAGVTYEAVTDRAGRYEIRLAGTVPAGRYRVRCAGATRIATVAPDRTVTVDHRGVDAELARVRPA